MGSSISEPIDVALWVAVEGCSALATDATIRIAVMTIPKIGAENLSAPLRPVLVFSALRRVEMSAIHDDRDITALP